MDFEYLDIHVHLDYGADVAPFVETAQRLKLACAVSACGPMFCQPGNEAVEEAMRKYPETIIGMGYVALGRGDGPETVEDLHARGFGGLKMIAPTKDYDDESFYPIYAKAEELKMPILFHTGVVARSDVMLEERKKAGKPVPPHDDPRAFNISSKRMEPMCVDTVARAFPDLNCIMAHFGSTGRRDVSQGIIRWNPNVYGDLTEFSWAFEVEEGSPGWRIEPKHVELFLGILQPLRPQRYAGKLLYGTDTTVSDPRLMDAKLASHKAVYEALGINEATRRAMLRDTAARLLGLE